MSWCLLILWTLKSFPNMKREDTSENKNLQTIITWSIGYIMFIYYFFHDCLPVHFQTDFLPICSIFFNIQISIGTISVKIMRKWKNTFHLQVRYDLKNFILTQEWLDEILIWLHWIPDWNNSIIFLEYDRYHAGKLIWKF